MKTYTLYLIRHGVTQGNLDGVYVGQSDSALCPAGVDDLKKLREAAQYPEVPIVFSSPLKRSLESAEILFPGIKPLVIDGFIEYNFGSFDGHTAEELKDNETFQKWLSGDPEVAPPYGESTAEFQNRVSETFIKVVEGILKTGVTESAIVTHGGVIMAIMALFALPEASMTQWMTDPGCGYALRLSTQLWATGHKLEAFAEIPEFPDVPEELEERPLWVEVETTEEDN